MMVYGTLIETRVFGKLIPFVVYASALIFEQITAWMTRGSQPRREPSRDSDPAEGSLRAVRAGFQNLRRFRLGCSARPYSLPVPP